MKRASEAETPYSVFETSPVDVAVTLCTVSGGVLCESGCSARPFDRGKAEGALTTILRQTLAGSWAALDVTVVGVPLMWDSFASLLRCC